MALTVLNGVNATLTGVGGKWENVSIDTGMALLPTTGFGDSWTNFISNGVKNFSGRLGGYVSKGDADSNPYDLADGQTRTITITHDTGCSIECPVLIGGVSITMSRTGGQQVTVDFAKGDNTAPTVTWSES